MSGDCGSMHAPLEARIKALEVRIMKTDALIGELIAEVRGLREDMRALGGQFAVEVTRLVKAVIKKK